MVKYNYQFEKIKAEKIFHIFFFIHLNMRKFEIKCY